MAVFKCKICGGNLEVQEGMSVCECEYCGTKQTLPKMNDERRANLYDRANHFRRNNEFDKAMGMYEQILQEDREDAEAYWSLVLCTYGIEYVEDPASHTRKPTVNRTQYTSVFADENYKAALKYADESQKAIYEEEAKQIDAIQKGILDISGREEPFDVFICYKETDAAGQRTQDSVLANDLYHQLTQEGFKVFFARITLEDKLGSAYEPYIFAALNSAKVMVVLGTRPEYFNAVWVRNEWSRYLGLIKKGEKKVLIPAYKDMDPYDLPQEFSHLQSQDMGKLGFMQDLIRGIRKLTGADEKEQSAASAGMAGNEAAALLKRMFLFLEDGDFGKADEYSERVLNLDPENAEAYLGKLMARLKVCRREELAQCAGRLDAADAYQKLMRFGGESLRKEAEDYNQQIIKRLNEEEEKRREQAYQGALQLLASAGKSSQLKDVIHRLKALGEYKDAAAHMAATAEKLAQLEKKERAQRKRKGTMAAVFTAAVIAVAVVSLNIASAVKKRNQYNQAVQNAEYLLQEGNYESAYREFSELLGEEQAKKEIISAMYSAAVDYLENEKFQEAVSMLNSMSGFTDDYTKEAEQLGNAMYEKAQEYVREGEYEQVSELFAAIRGLPEAADLSAAAAELGNAMYQKAQEYVGTEEYEKTDKLLSMLGAIPDSVDLSAAAAELGYTMFQKVQENINAEEYDKAEQLLSEIAKNKNDVNMRDTATQLENTMYQKAQEYVNEGEYNKVERLLTVIGEIPNTAGESESAAQFGGVIYQAAWQCMKENRLDDAEAARSLMEHEQMVKYQSPIDETRLDLAGASVGDTVVFGEEPDPGQYQGAIEWRVLEKRENGEVLLTSSIHSIAHVMLESLHTSWKDSVVRKWLNDDFYNTRFSAEEQALIVNSTLQNERFQMEKRPFYWSNKMPAEWHSGEGWVISDETFYQGSQKTEETEDKVFLISLSETIKYGFKGYRLSRSSGFYVDSMTGEYVEELLYQGRNLKQDIDGSYWVAGVVESENVLPATIKPIEYAMGTSEAFIDGGSGRYVDLRGDIGIWVNPYLE